MSQIRGGRGSSNGIAAVRVVVALVVVGGESDCCGGSHMTEHSVAEYGDGCDRRRRGEVGEEGE